MTNTTLNLQRFLLIGIGQLVSLMGSSLTGFALGLWVYQRTGSTTQFAWTALIALLPGIIVSPLAGALVDRWDRRHAMMLSDAGSAFGTLLLALLLAADTLRLEHIYAVVAFNSALGALQWPAYSAVATVLVPKQHLGRASGLVQIGEGLTQVVAPLLGAVLLASIGLWGVIVLDIASFIFAFATLAMVRVPRPVGSAESVAARGSLRREIALGWVYIVSRRGLLALLIFPTCTRFTLGIVQILITPLTLAFTSPTTLGLILSIGGSGMLMGSVLFSAWGGPQRRIHGVLGPTLLQGLLLFLGGLQPSPLLIAAATFAFMACYPVMEGSNQLIWQSKVPPDLQGRVFAVRRMVARSSLPLSYLAAGPLADVFEPLMSSDGALAGTMGALIGVGEGRGIGLLFLVLGVLTVLVVVLAYSYPPLRDLDRQLPDPV